MNKGISHEASSSWKKKKPCNYFPLSKRTSNNVITEMRLSWEMIPLGDLLCCPHPPSLHKHNENMRFVPHIKTTLDEIKHFLSTKVFCAVLRNEYHYLEDWILTWLIFQMLYCMQETINTKHTLSMTCWGVWWPLGNTSKWWELGNDDKVSRFSSSCPWKEVEEGWRFTQSSSCWLLPMEVSSDFPLYVCLDEQQEAFMQNKKQSHQRYCQSNHFKRRLEFRIILFHPSYYSSLFFCPV